MEKTIIKPQDGFQELYMSSPADIIIGGGSAGGGKTYVLLMEAMRHCKVKDYGAVIFRRTMPEVTNEGGLWDTSMSLYPYIGGKQKDSVKTWVFLDENEKPISKIKFSHVQYEKDLESWQGSQIPFIGFDELTHFTKKQFFYLLSRNRSMCGIKPCIRATCNPDPDSWVRKFIDWWIGEDGYPIPERDGVIRYFTKDGEHYVWGDTKKEVVDKAPHLFSSKALKNMKTDDLVKSVTFIRGDVHGNKELISKDPAYLANLLTLDEIEKKKLLKGNWNVTQDGMALCDYSAIQDLFSNFVDESDKMRLTCDVAWKGRDLAVMMTWKGWKVIKINIFTKCEIIDIMKYIEKERKRVKIAKSDCLVDQDGVGAGLVGYGYEGFSGDGKVLDDPLTGIKENYANLKTQCAYRMADRINDNEVSISLDNIFVDGVKTAIVKVGKVEYNVEDLIKSDLKSFKRKDAEKDGKKKMITKEKQKIILGGRSPDNGDTIMMKEWFELRVEVNCDVLIY